MNRVLHAVLAVPLLLALAGRPASAEDAPRFVGAQACAECHAAETNAWKRSHHAQAMQPALPATVLGDFSNATLEHFGMTARFFRDDDRFMVRIDGPDHMLHDYPIAYTFGVYPLQQYLIVLSGGRYQVLGIAWDSRPKDQGGQRWYYLYPDQPLHAGDRLHWTGRDQTWNYQCAACHSTDLQKNFDVATNTYATKFSDVNVACEACHGPGSRHITWAKTGTGDPHKGLVVWLTAADRGKWEMNPQTGIAHRTELASPAELNACGGCHARRSVIASGATAFLDAYLPALLEPGQYHADGQIDGEVFEYGSFVQSRMFHAGVTCTNCHEPHTARLREQGNSLCAQCHMPQKFDIAQHHHHKQDSPGAQCVNCHMPTKTYMGVDLRRDHSFRVPRPDLTMTIGVPNTCTQCHADKSADWAAKTIAAWFPEGRQATSHYGLALDVGRTGLADTEAQLDALIRNTTAPAIARASALQALPPYATAASELTVEASVSDPEPLVRLAAPAMLAGRPSPTIIKEVTSLLSDPIRAVRIQAARALAGVDPSTLTSAQRSAYDSANKELVAAEMINADRPEAHLNLGLLAVRQGRADEAEAQYQTALRLDPSFVPAMLNLADLDRTRGMDQEGAALLRKAIAIEPDNADVHYAFGLLLVRQHDPAAMAELRQANELAPANARYAYVYAVALNSTGAAAPAMMLLEHTHQQHQADRDVLVALVSIAQQQGDQPTALRHARELAALEPNDEQIRRLVQQLSGAVAH